MAVDPIPLTRKEVLARLGDFSFELLTLVPDKMDRETMYRWVRQEPINAPPVFQYLGANPRDETATAHQDIWTVAGVLYPEVSGRIDHLKKLRDIALSGKPQRFVYADTVLGQNLGLCIIHRIKESRTIFYGDGIPRKIEFTLELEKFSAQSTAQ
jgi:phage protein U